MLWKTKASTRCAHTQLPGNLLGLLLSPFILMTLGWRALFLVFGVLGAPLLAVWLATVPDAPAGAQQQAQQQPQTQPPAAAAGGGLQQQAAGGKGGGGGGVTLGKLLSHPATWAIVVVNFVNHWGYFIYLNWMPTYFSKVRSEGWPAVVTGSLLLVKQLICAVFGACAARLVTCACSSFTCLSPQPRHAFT